MAGRGPLYVTSEQATALSRLLRRRITAGMGIRVDEGDQGAVVSSIEGKGWDVQPQVIPARIVGWQQIGSLRRWRYSWEPVALNASDDDVTLDTYILGTFSNLYALNWYEVNNLVNHGGTQGNSINETASGFPAGFQLQPVGGGTGGIPANQVIVPLQPYSRLDGETVMMFWYVNAEQGPCE